MRSFHQDRLGTNIGKALKKTYRFLRYAAMPFSNRGSPEQDYGGGAAYANFRYFSEMLSAQFMGSQVDVALADFRESHYGTLSSMTVKKRHFCAICIYRNDHFTKTGSVQHSKKLAFP